MAKYRILNLYAGIGGNRKLWDKPLREKFGSDYQIVAIEHNEEIASIYHDFFPNDEIIVTDAHQYLLDYFKEFDFIWGSPPCPSHSITNYYLHAQNVIRYPEMSLYQEIILLNTFFKGKFVIENVKPYYSPLINPSIKLDRHLFWTNYFINKINVESNTIGRFGKLKNGNRIDNCKDGHFGFYINKFKVKNKEKLRRNTVNPKIGLHFLNRALEIKEINNITQKTIFDD
jgi:DNA (cytosine-5)-methyltransferase 1